MNQSNIQELACNRWLAQVSLHSGGNVLVHINRASPIDAKGAMKVARNAAKFGKVAHLLPMGPCTALAEDDEW
ncbi:MAG: hypothetical protein HZT41_14915 [Dechloromonas sp.]|jgi:hypothetical protein|nr:hypothetical protein [Thiobacillaceae bacterium]QLQ25971.1 MAG: hypothetical protein HZT41_14915 [Dechloromonas sp.]